MFVFKTTLEELANLNDAQLVIHCTACSSLFLWCDPCSPMIPGVAPGAQQQVQTKRASCWTLSDVVLFLSLFLPSSLASSAWWSAPETLSPYFLFDILVPCFFSYCCPTLVVRWTVLLPKTLNRWTGLHYQRWVSVSSAWWSATLLMFSYRSMLSLWMDAIKVSGHRDGQFINNIKTCLCLCVYIKNEENVTALTATFMSVQWTRSHFQQ